MPVITNYFRMDGWVKSAQGPAIPGAQIYVCTQPANTVALPPSPLANIFADVNGLVPITQPILTDGFGHYDFYAQAAVYTIVVGFGGVVQEFYPDQSLGGASGTSGGTALVIAVDGVMPANQLLLNLIGSGSTEVTTDGAGNVTIAGSTFQTNGVANTLQSKLNLIQGSNVTLTADDAGGVTIAASGGSFGTTGVGGFWSAGYPMQAPNGFSWSSGPVLCTAQGQVIVWEFTLESTWTISTVSLYVATGAFGGSTGNAGIYSVAGNKLLDSGSFTFGSLETNTGHSNTITPVTLQAGTYYFACSISNQNTTLSVFNLSAPVGVVTLLNGTGSSLKIAFAANAVSGGLLPATLGALTTTVSNQCSMPAVFFGV